jgi:hypothetical protein
VLSGQGSEYVCFFSHQGYAMAWYEADVSDDPPYNFYYEVEYSVDPKGYTVSKFDRLSEFFEREFQQWCDLRS